MYDLIIIGGGVWGTSAALAAMRAGARSVLLIERNIGVAQESSGKSGGILTDLLWHPHDQQLVARSRELYVEARTRTGDLSVVRELGMLTLATAEGAVDIEGRVPELRERGVRHELLSRNALKRRYPALDRLPGDTIALFTPDDCALNPTAFAQASLDAARELGLEARFGCPALSITPEENRVAVGIADGVLHARRVLVTAGTWSRRLLRTAGFDLALIPYRVQLSSLALPRPHGLPIVWDLQTDVYLVPDGPENLLAGDGTRPWEHDPDNYQETGDSAFHTDIADRVPALLSLGDHAGMRSSWAGLCGATPDRRPLLGALGRGVSIACGDNGIGVMRGPALGELAALVSLDLAEAQSLQPSRFPAVPFEVRGGFTLS